MSVQNEIDRIAGAKTTLGSYLQQNGVAVQQGATLDQMALLLADVIEKQDKIIVSGILKGNGKGGVTAAKAGTDYVPWYEVYVSYVSGDGTSGYTSSDTLSDVLNAVGSGQTCFAMLQGTYDTTIYILSYIDMLNYSSIVFSRADGRGGDELTVTEAGWSRAIYSVPEIPEAGLAAEGAFLRVVNGAWATATIQNANGGSF